MFRTLARCAIVLAVLAVQPACDRHDGRSPNVPTGPSSREVSITNLQLAGPDRIAPGTTAQLTAMAVKSDGSREDVTARVKWSSDRADVLSVASDGGVSARTTGAATVTGILDDSWVVTRVVLVVPPNSFVLSGVVRQLTYPVADAKVEVVSAATGTGLSTVTDAAGHFDLFGVAGAVKLRAGKDDYHATFRTFDVAADRTVEVELKPTDALPVLRGAYTVTFSVPPCAFGFFTKDIRKRTYRAQVSSDGDQVDVRLSGATFVVANGTGDHFSVGLLPGRFALNLAQGYYAVGYDVVEQITPDHTIAIYGSGQASGTPERITGVLDGGFVLDPGDYGGARSICEGPVTVSLVKQ